MNSVHHSRKYSLNEYFFSHWNQSSSYVYGFWLADGSMRVSKSYRISFCSKDRLHLLDVGRAMGSNAPLERDKRADVYTLVLRSKMLYSQLYTLGGRPSKSRNLRFPSIPDRYYSDFIRGYFDGDGSVYKLRYRASKNNKYYYEIRSNFTCGNQNYLICLRDYLNLKVGLKKRAVSQYGPYQFKLSYSQTDTEKLLKYMYYPDHTLSLSRKRKFLELF